jgi:hypothetical protein
MSAPQPQVLESVQQLANWFAYLAGRGDIPDPQSEVYGRLTQGLSAAEIAQAQEYARLAEQLRRELLAAPPGTQLHELPGYAALGTTPVIQIQHDFTTEQVDAQGRSYTRHERPMEEFRGGPYFSLAFAEEQFAVQGFEVPGSDAEGDYQGYDVSSIKPFDLYA